MGDDAFNEIFQLVAVRLLKKWDAVLRVGGACADQMARVGSELGRSIYSSLGEIARGE